MPPAIEIHHHGSCSVGAASSRDDNAAWCAKYVGIPFADRGRSREGVDCWGLVRLVYAERLDIALPDYGGDYEDTLDAAAISRLLCNEAACWILADVPRPYDVALLRIRGIPWHVGLVVDGSAMLHTLSGCDSVIVDYTGPLWAPRISGFYRYAA